MKLIQAQCRARLGAADVEFIVSVLGKELGAAQCLIKLLGDEESRDEILDDPALFRTLLEHSGCLQVSPRLYFYVLIRQAFIRSGIGDREVADYVAEVLTEFARQEGTQCVLPGQARQLDYFFEMLAALENADERTGFLLRLYIGNYSLFLAGLFPERIRARAELRGCPDVRYFSRIGQSQYRAASDHRLAQRYELSPILATLADRYETTRLALNDLSERLISLHNLN